jgi:hypothetical protein
MTGASMRTGPIWIGGSWGMGSAQIKAKALAGKVRLG